MMQLHPGVAVACDLGQRSPWTIHYQDGYSEYIGDQENDCQVEKQLRTLCNLEASLQDQQTSSVQFLLWTVYMCLAWKKNLKNSGINKLILITQKTEIQYNQEPLKKIKCDINYILWL